MDTKTLNKDTQPKDDKTSSPSIPNSKSSKEFMKSVLIAVGVMVVLFGVAIFGLSQVINSETSSELKEISSAGDSFGEWAASNPDEAKSIYDQEMTFSEFSSLTGVESSIDGMTVKVSSFGNSDSRVCFTSSRMVANNFLYSTVTGKAEAVDNC